MQDEVISEFKSSIDSAIDSLKTNLKKLRTGRANVDVLDGIRVDYFGTPTPINQCANLTVADARTILVQPWDKSILSSVEKALLQSQLGITPQNDGQMIRLPIPPLTEERRKDLVKQSKARGEEAKISIRNARRDANEMLKQFEKDKELSKDELKRALDVVQEQTDQGTGEVDKVLATKEKEIMEI